MPLLWRRSDTKRFSCPRRYHPVKIVIVAMTSSEIRTKCDRDASLSTVDLAHCER